MKYCVFLLIAGAADAILTHIGIAAGLFEEGNPFMNFVIELDWFYFYLIKILLPLLLIGLFGIKPFTKNVKALLVSACSLYLIVIVYHIGLLFLYD